MKTYAIKNNQGGTTTILEGGMPVAIVPSVLDGIDVRDPAILGDLVKMNQWMKAAAAYALKHSRGGE